MFQGIKQDSIGSFDIVWDLGRRCTFACTYCGPHHSNKWSPNTPLATLQHTLDGVVEYVDIMNQHRKEDMVATLAFTGGEPTINPDFFEFIAYAKRTYPDLNTNVTTNGCFSLRKTEQIIDNIGSTTVSWHAEATDMEKMLVRQTLEVMANENYNVRVNVMFHKDYFDEAVGICDWLDEIGVKYTPRVIGDSGNEEDVKDGTAHIYTREQLQWFKDYWNRGKEAVNNDAEETKTAQNIGRPCCAQRPLELKLDGEWQKGTFVPSNDFYGWNCMINWDFLFVNSELDGVWHHQTCQVNLEGRVGPIGKASEFDKINEKLRAQMSTGQMPVIKCPKRWCGCGLCSPKAVLEEDMTEIWNQRVKGLTPIMQKEVHEDGHADTIFRRLKNDKQ